MRCQSSKDASTVWANLPMPATLHTARGGPSWETMSFIVVATESGSLTSEGNAVARFGRQEHGSRPSEARRGTGHHRHPARETLAVRQGGHRSSSVCDDPSAG